MNFNLAEKLAIVNMIDQVIYVDGVVHNGEIGAMGQVMKMLDFDSNFILQARNIPSSQSLLILNDMSNQKKQIFSNLLEKIAISDGYKHEKEIKLLKKVFSYMGMREESK